MYRFTRNYMCAQCDNGRGILKDRHQAVYIHYLSNAIVSPNPLNIQCRFPVKLAKAVT